MCFSILRELRDFPLRKKEFFFSRALEISTVKKTLGNV